MKDNLEGGIPETQDIVTLLRLLSLQVRLGISYSGRLDFKLLESYRLLACVDGVV